MNVCSNYSSNRFNTLINTVLFNRKLFFINSGSVVRMANQNRVEEEIVQVVQQNVSLFSPSSYNLPHFKYKHLPPSETRNSWVGWIRWFESIMAAANVTDGASRKMQLLAMGGLELQNAFYGIPGFDSNIPNLDPYQCAKEKLNQLFSPKHHDSFERFMFWTMTPDEDETIDKFHNKCKQIVRKTAQYSRLESLLRTMRL